MIELKNGDCTSVLTGLPDSIIDMTITSPPYDDLRTYNNATVFNEKTWMTVLAELYRVTKEGGVVVWIVNDATKKGSETGSSFKQALFAMECGFNLHDTMIWEKPHFANPSNTRYHQVFEYMFIFSKGKPKTFNPIKDVPVKYGKPFGKLSQRKANGDVINSENLITTVNKFSARKNVWKMNTVGQENIGKKQAHPAAFPVCLVLDHIKTWSNNGDIILDPFMGSGTTGVAAIKLSRNFIGIEVDDSYFNMARDRIEGLQ